MKTTNILAGCLLIIFSCSNPAPKNDDLLKEKFTKIEWITGHWVRSNDQPGKITYEQWERVSDLEYKGKGFTVSIDESIFEPDTVFNESLRILVMNDTLVYEVVGINEYPTLFKFTEQTDSSFVCVNPENEFPKEIAYLHKKRQMIAAISDGNQTMQFNFRRD